MRTFSQLSEAEQAKAVSIATSNITLAICEGALRFNDKANGDDLQARIDAAMQKAEQMQAPWFAHEYLMEAAGDEIRAMARCDAEDSLYPAPGDRIIHLDRED